jgi:hypothetical protein
MNLVGKILTFFIFVMSIFFCAFAVGIYATHTNWREIVLNPTAAPGKPLGLQEQLKNERAENEQLEGDKARLEASLTAERDAAVQALIQADNEHVLLKQQHGQLQKDLNDTNQERREALAQLKTTEDRLAVLRREVEGDQDVPGLRNEILQAQKEREKYFNEMVRRTDEKHEAVNELRRLRDYQKVLRQDLDNAVTVLRKFGLDKDRDYDEVPPDVDGVVTTATSRGLVEINIGSDDGLLKGHQLVVYRPSGTLVGKIEVIKTHFDVSVCQVVRGTLQSPVQKNDLVTSRFHQLSLSSRSQNLTKPRPAG